MRIGLITTIDTNIGDDFIREGICRVIRSLVPDQRLEFVAVNKHSPIGVYPKWHPVKVLRSRRIRPGAARRACRSVSNRILGMGLTHFDSCDAIVQCGAPVYWPDCAHTAWREELWEEVVERLHRRIPVLNLAAGSCYPYDRQPEYFESGEDRQYARWLHSLCRATAVRDQLAFRLLGDAGCNAELIPCSAFLFTTPSDATETADGPVLISYMRGGGHQYGWSEGAEPEIWQSATRQLIDRLRKRHRVAMLCHNEEEAGLARELDPTCECIVPRTYSEFPRMVRTAKAALCNRMHAAVALAGMGIPSVAVCTDTRLLMVKQLGLPCFYVKDASAPQLEADLERLIASRHEVAASLKSLQEKTMAKYQDILKAHLR